MTARAFPQRYLLPIAGLAATLTLSACFGAPPPAPAPAPAPSPPPPDGGTAAPPGPVACQNAEAVSVDTNPAPPPDPSPVPVPPDEAAQLAREAVAASSARTSDGQIPLVTLEETPVGPRISSTPVDTVEQAAAVAGDRAADGDLVAVDVDSPVQALDHASDDPRRDEQWALDQVSFEQAWGIANNGTNVRVAVVDTGVRKTHPDLAGQVLDGHFFLHSDDGKHSLEGPGGTPDDYGHGTHVAGIIAAVANNQTGVTGGAPGVKVVPVQVLCGDTGDGFNSDVAAGIRWAADPAKGNADVINLSLGGGPSGLVLDALKYAESQGVIVVASAGNDGAGGPASYPAAYSESTHEAEAIAVAATKNTSPPTRASYSTTGSYVDIAAPGGEPSSNTAISVLSTWKNGGYATSAGTSMAAPHVSAAAALLAAKGCSAAQVRNRLTSTADDLGAPGVDQHFGAGFVDPLEAVASCV